MRHPWVEVCNMRRTKLREDIPEPVDDEHSVVVEEEAGERRRRRWKVAEEGEGVC